MEFAGRFRNYRSIESSKGKLISGKLNYSAYLNPKEFNERILALKKIHHISYEFSTIGVPSSDVTPAPNLVARQKFTVFYDRKVQHTHSLMEQVANFSRKYYDKIKDFAVTGKDEDGDAISLNLFDDPSIFNESEFKDFNVELEVDENIEQAIKDSENLKQLVGLSKQTSVKDFFYSKVES